MNQRLDKLVLPVRPAVKSFSRHYGLQFAASISYRAFFSAIPLLAFLVTILGLVLQDESLQESFVDAVIAEVPFDAAARAEFEKIIRDLAAPRTAAGFVSILLLLWSASGLLGGIRAALNAAWEVEDRRSFVRGKVIDVLFVCGVGLLLLIGIGILVAARVVTAHTELVSGSLANALAWLVAVVVPLALFTVACMLTYRYVPTSRPRWSDVIPGTAIAVVGIEGVWIGYALFADYMADIDAVYGPLGVIFGLLLFVYISAIVLILGAEYSAARAKTRSARDPHVGESAGTS